MEDRFPDNYNGDSEIGLFIDVIHHEGEQIFDESLLPEQPPNRYPPVEADSDDITPPLMKHVNIEQRAIQKLVALELIIRGEKISSKKEDLRICLKDAIKKKKMVIKTRDQPKEAEKKLDDNMMVGFGLTAYWRVLNPNKDIAMEP